MEENKPGQNQAGMGMGSGNNANCSCGCGKMGMCSCGGHRHGHFALRLILGLIILMLVFGMGLKIGELKGSIESGYGEFGHHRMMMPYMMGSDYNMMNGAAGAGMMAPQTNLKTPAK